MCLVYRPVKYIFNSTEGRKAFVTYKVEKGFNISAYSKNQSIKNKSWQRILMGNPQETINKQKILHLTNREVEIITIMVNHFSYSNLENKFDKVKGDTGSPLLIAGKSIY